MVGCGDDGQSFTERRPPAWRNGQYSYLPHEAAAPSLQADSYAHDISDAGASSWDYFGLGIVVGESNGVATMWCAPCVADTCPAARIDPMAEPQPEQSPGE
jgi:hypothetical protein